MAKLKILQTPHGQILVNPNDRFIVPEIEQTGTYARDDIMLLMSLVEFLINKHGSATVYDVGANFGTHSLAIASKFGGSVKVRAFEAQRQIFHALCGTMALNGLSNVYCHNMAITDGSTKSLEFDLPDYDTTNNFGGLELVPANRSDNADIKKTGKETVACGTIDEFDEPVHLIKLDIEGMEYPALQGARGAIDKHRPICFVEVLKSDTAPIQAFFEPRDYRIVPFSAMDWLVMPKEIWEDGFEK